MNRGNFAAVLRLIARAVRMVKSHGHEATEAHLLEAADAVVSGEDIPEEPEAPKGSAKK